MKKKNLKNLNTLVRLLHGSSNKIVLEQYTKQSIAAVPVSHDYHFLHWFSGKEKDKGSCSAGSSSCSGSLIVAGLITFYTYIWQISSSLF